MHTHSYLISIPMYTKRHVCVYFTFNTYLTTHEVRQSGLRVLYNIGVCGDKGNTQSVNHIGYLRIQTRKQISVVVMATGGEEKSLVVHEEREELDTVFRETMEQYYISSQGIQILSQQGFGCFQQVDKMKYEIAKEFVHEMPLKIADKVAFLSLIHDRNQPTESDLRQVTLHEDMAKPMTTHHQEIIRKRLYDFSEVLKIPPLLIKLQAMGTITQHERDHCHSKPTPLEQGCELLTTLQKGSDRCFHDLVRALEVTNQSHLAKQLLTDDAESQGNLYLYMYLSTYHSMFLYNMQFNLCIESHIFLYKVSCRFCYLQIAYHQYG